MQLSDGLRISGALTASIRNTRTCEETSFTTPNLVVLSGRDLICALLAREPGVLGLTAFALGEGIEPTAPTTLGLEDEVFRSTNITAFTPMPGQGRLRIEYHLSTSEAVPAVITEAGLFGGDAAGSVLVARVVLERPMIRQANPAGVSDEEVRFSWLLSMKAEVT